MKLLKIFGRDLYKVLRTVVDIFVLYISVCCGALFCIASALHIFDFIITSFPIITPADYVSFEQPDILFYPMIIGSISTIVGIFWLHRRFDPKAAVSFQYITKSILTIAKLLGIVIFVSGSLVSLIMAIVYAADTYIMSYAIDVTTTTPWIDYVITTWHSDTIFRNIITILGMTPIFGTISIYVLSLYERSR